uniref:Adenylate cyclase n=1 Tax=Magnetococcus massalia (strain MO-1) TaxID=451514 RepID=A0A1S7LFK8_MAGMO|nr:Conserved protein of unknown function [Candidatus Magnetococcus massalia]
MFPSGGIRLRVPHEQSSDFAHHPVLLSAQPLGPVKAATIRFYDTPDHTLRKRGLELQIGHDEQGWWQRLLRLDEVGSGGGQGIKGGRGQKLAHWPLAKGRPDWLLLQHHAVAMEAMAGVDIGLLGPRFSVAYRRRRLRLQRADGSRLQLREERGIIYMGDRQEPFHDIQLRSRAAHGSFAFEVALALHSYLRAGLLFAPPIERIWSQLVPYQQHNRPQASWHWPSFSVRKRATTLEGYHALCEPLFNLWMEQAVWMAHGDPSAARRAHLLGAELLKALQQLAVWFPFFSHSEAQPRLSRATLQLQGALENEGMQQLLDRYTESLPQGEESGQAIWNHRLLAHWHLEKRQWLDYLHSDEMAETLLGLGLWFARQGWLQHKSADELPDKVEPLRRWVRDRLHDQQWPMIQGLQSKERGALLAGAEKLWQQQLIMRFFGSFFSTVRPQRDLLTLDLSLLESGIYLDALGRVAKNRQLLEQIEGAPSRLRAWIPDVPEAFIETWQDWIDDERQILSQDLARGIAELELSGGFWMEASA